MSSGRIFNLVLAAALSLHVQPGAAASVAQFFQEACSEPCVARRFISSSSENLERGVLIEYKNVRWCAVLLPPFKNSRSKLTPLLNDERARQASMKAMHVLTSSLRRDAAGDLASFSRWGNEYFTRFIQTVSGPVEEGGAALVWRRVDDLR